MFGSNCYKYPGGDTADWADAESHCQGLLAGAHLAAIHSAEEMQFVQDNVPTNHFWLGGSDLNEEGSFTWTDGSRWDYTEWFKGEPNNDLGSEHCLEDLYDYEQGWVDWNDRPCSEIRHFVCKAPLVSVN